MVSEDESASGAKTAGFAPCFPVRDVQTALAHYEQLGFDVMPYAPGMDWAWVRLGGAELHLFQKEDHDPARTAAAADLQVDDADDAAYVLFEPGGCAESACRISMVLASSRSAWLEAPAGQ